MSGIGTVIGVVVGFYWLASVAFLISDNRRPQASLAWMLALVFVPGFGLLAYVLFGRGRYAFIRRSTRVRRLLEVKAPPLLSPMFARQDEEVAAIAAGGGGRRLAQLVRSNSFSALSRRNRVEILQDASTFYPRMIEDIRAARHSIHLQYYIWQADEFTESLLDILAAKVREGVEVRLLYDPIGSRAWATRRYWRKVRDAGIKVSPTAPLWHLQTISYRNHRKISVIDGTIGYTGGMNIGKEHLDGGKGFGFWRDTQLRIVGEAVAALQVVFLAEWYGAVGEDLVVAAYFPPVSDVEDGVPTQILVSGPDSKWEAIRQLYFLMIMSAQDHIIIQSPFFVIDSSIAEALKSAAMAGVDVKVMLATGSADVVPEWAGNTFIMDVVAAGVRVFQYEKGYLHSKIISVDGMVSSVGSANIDIRSFSINFELNAVLYDRDLAASIERAFAADLADCTAFDPALYAARNRLLRFRDSAARLLSPLL